MTIALIVALLLGGSASIAAENSTPGDALYPVKTTLNENVRGALTFSSEAKANWDARLAERRLEEVEELTAEGELNAEVSAVLDASLDKHIRAFEKKIAELKAEGSMSSVVEAHSVFEGKLRAHAQALANISVHAPDARAHLEPILTRVQAGLSSSSRARAEAEVALVAEGGAEVQAKAEGKLNAAENKLEETKNFLAKVKSSLDGSAKVAVDTRLSAADAALVRGKAELAAGTYGEAFVSFQEVIRIAQEVKALANTARVQVKAEEGFNLRVEGTSSEGEGSLENSTNEENSSGASADVRADGEVRGGGASTTGTVRVNLEL